MKKQNEIMRVVVGCAGGKPNAICKGAGVGGFV